MRSLCVNVSWILSVLLTNLIVKVSCHGAMTSPVPRPGVFPQDTGTSVTQWYQQMEPIWTLQGPKASEDQTSYTYSSTSFRCRDSTTPSSPLTQLTTGSTFPLTVNFESCTECNHPGDCFLYLSYDSDTTSPVNWFKIAQIPGCANMKNSPDGIVPPTSAQTFTITVPPALPPCPHCVMRFEWIAPTDASANPPLIEFYANCVDVTIINNNPNSYDPNNKPGPTTAISGISHLPTSVTGYPGYRDVYGSFAQTGYTKQLGHRYLVGPALWSGAIPYGYIDTGTGDIPTTPAPTGTISTTTTTSPSGTTTTTKVNTVTTTNPSSTTTTVNTPTSPTIGTSTGGPISTGPSSIIPSTSILYTTPTKQSANNAMSVTFNLGSWMVLLVIINLFVILVNF